MTAMEKRPSCLPSVTISRETGCGKIFVTISFLNGKPFEVFTQIGKAGGCAASQSEMGGRLISVALRSGVEPEALIKQLKGIRCHSPFGLGESAVLSCADAIAKSIEDVLKNLATHTEASQALSPKLAIPA